MGFIALQTATAHAQTNKPAQNPAVQSDAWALAHAIQTEAHPTTISEEAVLYAVLQRSETGWYGKKGNIYSTVHWPAQFSGPRKWKPWQSKKSEERQRWNRVLPMAQQALQKWRQGQTPISASLQKQLKGCVNFDLVVRTDLGRPCGKFGGNYYYRPAGL